MIIDKQHGIYLITVDNQTWLCNTWTEFLYTYHMLKEMYA